MFLCFFCSGRGSPGSCLSRQAQAGSADAVVSTDRIPIGATAAEVAAAVSTLPGYAGAQVTKTVDISQGSLKVAYTMLFPQAVSALADLPILKGPA